MDELHPGAKWIFRLRAYFGIFFIGIFLGVFAFQVLIISVIRSGNFPLRLFLSPFLAIVFIIVVGEVYSRLAYKNWRYEFGKDSVKLERGIIWKKYTNVPYNRIQNIDIHRGIFARMLGFSALDLQTAGASYYGRGVPRSEGHIPAVSVKKADQLRDFLMGKISKRSNGM